MVAPALADTLSWWIPSDTHVEDAPLLHTAVGVRLICGFRSAQSGQVTPLGAPMRVRWYVWVAAFLPAVAGGVSLVLDDTGDFRSSGLMAGVGVTLGVLAVLLGLLRPWRTRSGRSKLGSIAGVGLLGIAALAGIAGGVPELLQARFGWFVSPDAYGPRSVVGVDGGFVAVGNDRDGGVIWFSSDGSSWSRVSAAPLTGLEMRDLVVADDALVAIGAPSGSDQGVVLSSPDGQTWEVAARFGGGGEFGVYPIALALLDRELVVVTDTYGNDTAFFHGPDAETLRLSLPAPEHDDGDFVLSVACTSSSCVAVGGQTDIGVFTESSAGPAIWRSTDGAQWTLTGGGLGTAELSAVAARDEGFVVVGNNSDQGHGVVWTSPDGDEWTQVDGAVFQNAVIDGAVNLDHGLMAFGRDLETSAIVVWSSPDAMQWERTVVDSTAPVGSQIRSIAGRRPLIVAMGIDVASKSTAVWISTDGQVWNRLPADEAAFAGT